MIMWMTIYIQFRRYLNPENAFHGNCYELSTIPEQRFKSLRSTSDILRCTRLRIHPPWSAYSLGDSIFHSTGYANVNGASSDYSNARIDRKIRRAADVYANLPRSETPIRLLDNFFPMCSLS